MGAGDLNHRQFAQQVDLYTGGLIVSPHICAHHSNELGYEQVIVNYTVSMDVCLCVLFYICICINLCIYYCWIQKGFAEISPHIFYPL